MGICFQVEGRIETTLKDVLAASRPATPAEALRFDVKLPRGQFNRYVRIITKDVLMPPLYGSEGGYDFLVRAIDGPEVMLEWERLTGHGFVRLDHEPTMEWLAKEVWGRIAVGHEYYRLWLVRRKREQLEREKEAIEARLDKLNDPDHFWSHQDL